MHSPSDVQALFASADASLRGVLEKAIPDGALIAFDIDGGGTWTVRNDGGSIDIVAGRLDPVDCLFACSADDFRALVEGRLSSRRALLDGKVRIEGDVGLVQRLGDAFVKSRKKR